MAAYILWVQRHWDELAKDLPVISASYRDKMQAAGHSRLPDAFGKLMAAIDTALFFAVDCGALTDAQAASKKQVAQTALGLMIHEHGEAVDFVDACRIFQDCLIENLDARLWYVLPTTADNCAPPPNYPLGAALVGYYDDSYLYLLTKTVSDLIQNYQRVGTPFPVGRNTLYRRLIERGWLVSGEKATDTVYIKAMESSPRVLKLVKKHFLPE